MKTRVISAAALLAITAACMYLEITRVLYFSAAAVLCCFEMKKALAAAGIPSSQWVPYLYVAGNAALCCFSAHSAYLAGWFFLAVFLSMLTGILSPESGARRSLATLAVLVYPLSLLALITRLACLDGWLAVFVIACLATWLCDSFALFGGKLLGRHKLSPKVSPNKTVEGTVCGAVASAAAGLLSFLILRNAFAVPLWLCITASVVGSSFGQVGDLAASLVKRMAGLKDYSNLIPGHGGMLDRADSLLFSIPAAYFCLCLAGYITV